MKPKRAKKPTWKVIPDPEAISMTPIPGWTTHATETKQFPTRIELKEITPR